MENRSIEAILFDADGVIQRPAEGRKSKWQEVLGSSRGLDDFLADIFAAESLALEGRLNFADELAKVLSRWSALGALTDALAAWTMIKVDGEVAGAVRTLRRLGVACYLATNQESHRAWYMSETLGYKDLFDQEFYSCRIGVTKPKEAYFRAILEKTRIRPGSTLFLDDHKENVDSAQAVGLHAAQFSLTDGFAALHRKLKQFGIHVAQ
jgi:putative hydrolase of the HAD superfamily